MTSAQLFNKGQLEWQWMPLIGADMDLESLITVGRDWTIMSFWSVSPAVITRLKIHGEPDGEKRAIFG